jgi:hypothetical protein
VTRRICLAAVLLVLSSAAGCAHVEAPRGGPEMRDTLRLAAVVPDSLAVLPGLTGPAVFQFQRRLSERGLDDAVMVSPRTSPVVVSHRGRELRVSLRGGWQPGTIYQVTVLPEIQDLWNNRLTEQVDLTFSTGPEIPATHLEGRAIDRITGRPEVGIRVEAVRAADSLVYATRTDSVGGFVLARIPEGDYQVRAFRDLNRNRTLDPFEPRDTSAARVVAPDTVDLALSVVMPDTTPPQAASARLAQGILEIQFDDFLDPEQTLIPAQVTITDTLGAVVPVERLAVGRLPAAPDTVDTLAAPPAAQQPAAPPGAAVPPRGAVAADTVAPPARLPSQTLAVEPASPLAPRMEYRIRVEGVRNVVGLTGGGEATFTTPALPPPPPPAQEPDEPEPEEPEPDEPDPDL